MPDSISEALETTNAYSSEPILAVIDARPYQATVTLQMQSFHALKLSPDAVLVTYHASSRTDALRLSIWIRRDNRWQLLFHQGTEVAEQR